MDNLFFLEAKCGKTNQTFYMRFDKAAGGTWCRTYGVKHKPSDISGKMNHLAQINISNSTVGPQYKCPYCGNTGGVKCGNCGKFTCSSSGAKDFKCAYCGNTGTIGSGYVEKVKGSSGLGQ